MVKLASDRPDGIEIRPGLVIPEAEIELRASRSSGPGGQNVNKLNTRVELRFDLNGSRVLSDAEKQRIAGRLGSRLSAAGVVRVTAQRHRTRRQNEAAARGRLAELLQAALHQPRARRATRPSRRGTERRLAAKRRRSELKRGRGGRDAD
jgi:ribosome-associated protein